MPNHKLITVSLIVVLIAAIFFFWQGKQKADYPQQILLAQEIRKVTGYLMMDLRGVEQAHLKALPADGKWHNSLSFDKKGEGFVEYSWGQGHLLRTAKGNKKEIAALIHHLRVRRQSKSPNILEVQINAQNQAKLVSNFKVRLGY